MLDSGSLRKYAKVGLTVFLLLLVVRPALGCEMCRFAMEHQVVKKGMPHPRLAEGFFWSILLMAFMPLGMITGGTVLIARSGRKRKGPSSPAPSDSVGR